MKIIILSFILLNSAVACTQADSTNSEIHLLKAGQSVVQVERLKPVSSPGIQLLHLHSNEVTAYKVAKASALKEGFHFISIINNTDRRVPFYFNDTLYTFDPNRIFSDSGALKTVDPRKSIFSGLHKTVRQFADSLLVLMDTSSTVVALHNNTNNEFSILTYLKDQSGKVYQNPDLDHDDFFITNDEGVFQFLQSRRWNVVLEDVSQLEEDGSFSLMATRKGIRYINIEAEHFHEKEQQEMLNVLLEYLKSNKN